MNRCTKISNLRFLAEWELQKAVMMALPDETTDWCYMLDEVYACYREIANAIIESGEKLILVCNSTENAKNVMSALNQNLIEYIECPINDTWTRDYGPLTIDSNIGLCTLDFGFNGWGLKFASDKDNLVNKHIFSNNGKNIHYLNYRDYTLEGGSIETDGNGTLLTTSKCLMSANRNGELDKSQIESVLTQRLGVSHFLWLDYGFLAGDDTDSHIDTLARLCPNNRIVYVECTDPDDEHYEELNKMKQQLGNFRTRQNGKYELYALPMPDAIYDEDGYRLPATYANYLILNSQILMPTYNQPEKDTQAKAVLQKAMPGYKVITIDCCSLIRQHGSLHCSTMQLYK